MQVFNRDDVATALPYAALIDALQAAFAGRSEAPVRTHHRVPVADQADGNLLLMPAWQTGHSLGVKVATVFPDNAMRGIASVNASYLLLDATTGVPQAVMDGAELTLRRTAAASALASRYLSRRNSATLLMAGTGKLAPHLIQAHAAVRPITRVLVWGRRQEAAHAVSELPVLQMLNPEPVASLESAIAHADIISCATLAEQPLLRGEHLRAGQHIDLVGAFTPQMREADDVAVQRSSVFVDTFEGALAEAGDVIQAIENGSLARENILAELAGLVRNEHPGRGNDDEITLFKSVGTAIEDLAAAQLAADRRAGL